ncbi:MAG: OmpA family protein [Bacteroidota bacterium]
MTSRFFSTSFFLMIFCFFASISSGQEVKHSENEAVFNVVASSKSGKPREGEVITLISQKTKKSYQGTTSAEGKCTIIIPSADKYDIFYKHFNQQVKYHDVDVPGGEHRMSFTLSMKYDPPRTFTLKNVFFDTGKATLTKESYPALNELVDALKTKPAMVIEIAGHTDNTGSAEANQLLSAGRAGSVRDFLISKGVKPMQVKAKGYGETQPVADNSTEEGRQQNRRTEVRIIND